ncbi:3-oxoacyl-ACP reductase [Shewanella seohaensis]|uniref:3-oxoacyl-ACP reductase n=1 Tax=Shewanella seohaensis TaxID=755175 RepID=UPI0035B99CDE
MKNVIITGGTGGIGTALTSCFLSAGFFVYVTHCNKSKEFLDSWISHNKFSSHFIKFVNMDVNDCKSVELALSPILNNVKIDVLINNAGITSDSRFVNMTFEQWFNVINTNLISLFNVTKPVVSNMLTNQRGCIINISSINGLKGQFGQTNYSSSKAGMIGFTKSLALELAAKGIRVNAIAPGYTETPMVQNMRSEVLDSIKSMIPTKQLVQPQEIANTALFIAEGMTSLTGETISVNGGQYMS